MFAYKQVGTFPVILFLLLCVPFSGLTQEVIICKSQQDGNPRGAATEWKVDSFPVQLTLFYHHGKTTIDERSLNFIIEPESKLGIGPFEASVVVSQGRNWASTTFMFHRAGKYMVSAYRSDRTVMASTLFSVDGPEKEDVPAVVSAPPAATKPASAGATDVVQTISRDGVRYDGPQTTPTERVAIERPLTTEEQKTLKYEEVNIAFGTGVSGRKLEGVAESFTDSQTRKGILVQLSNPKPFGTDAIVIDIWKRSSANATDFDELVTNSSVTVSPKDYTAHAPITLFKKGAYKVSFFTPDMVWIGSSYLTVR
ncbi:MAG: hypothetical protein K9J06_15540 [Flavobacteriales bacterium]|nr:hypothetical protein [Flavobacteriales bacterium]